MRRSSMKVYATITAAVLCLALAGCQTGESTSIEAMGGHRADVLLGAMAPVAPAGSDATGAVALGAGDALGFQLYSSYVAYVRSNQSPQQGLYATGASPDPAQD